MIEAPQREVDPLDPQALIKEARRLRRRRWTIGGFGAIAAIAVAVALPLALVATPSGRRTKPASLERAGTLPNGALTTLHVAGSLAVGPTGALYVVDATAHRILVRLPDGRFRVVAGTGAVGESPDGTKALDARLTDPYQLTFGPGGALYFADQAQVRKIAANGTITTVAGNGAGGNTYLGAFTTSITDGTPALRAALGHVSFAFGPTGTLYLATSNQLLRMTPNGDLDQIVTHQDSWPSQLPKSLDRNLAEIGVDNKGNIIVTGFNGWAVWKVTPAGRATYIGYARGTGGSAPDVVRGPGGAVYLATDGGGGGPAVRGSVITVSFSGVRFPRNLPYFETMGIALAPNGELYADEVPGNRGFEAHQTLIAVNHDVARVLWTEHNAVSG
jgi:hypothetical protein